MGKIDMQTPPEHLTDSVPPRIVKYLRKFALHNHRKRWLLIDEELTGPMPQAEKDEWQTHEGFWLQLVSELETRGGGVMPVELLQSDKLIGHGITCFTIKFYCVGNPPPMYLIAY